jgi:hypothetical protein
VKKTVPDTHAVVYLELVKIPAILYAYTGKKAYLDEARNGLDKMLASQMLASQMLASGLPSSTVPYGSTLLGVTVFPCLPVERAGRPASQP